MQAATAARPHLDRAAFDPQRLAVDERIRDLPVRRVDDAAEGRARNVHLLGRLLLIETVEIRKAHGLELVEQENHFFKVDDRNADRLEDWRRRSSGDVPATERSGQAQELLTLL